MAQVTHFASAIGWGRGTAAILWTAIAGCSAPKAYQLDPAVVDCLRSATRIELFALDPQPLDRGGVVGALGAWHGYPVLGRAELSDAAQRRQLVELVIRGVEQHRDTVAACFNPRHGLSASAGDRRVELVICYECLSMSVHATGLGADAEGPAWTTDAVEAGVSQVYRDAGLTLSGK